MFLEGGRVATQLGNFSNRYLSTRNPLIGEPVSYGVSHPLGAKLHGSLNWFDFHVGVSNEPAIPKGFPPPPAEELRPVLAFGFTPIVGFRVGAYATQGSYLSRDLDALMPAGENWHDFDQQVVGLDLAFSTGHLEVNADFSFNSYEVPTYADSFEGHVYFAEVKYTWTPRLFTALRLETTEYVKVLPPGRFPIWLASPWKFDDVEVGVGWRFGRDTRLKLYLSRGRLA